MALRTVRKGQVIFEEGDALEKFFIVQSGSVQLGLRKDKKFLDFFAVGPNGFLGEYGLLGHAQHLFTAVARTETQLLEIPKQALKDELNTAPTFIKLLLKSTLERLKFSNQTLRHVKSPAQMSLFPDDRIPLYFAATYFTVKEKAVESKGEWQIDFRLFKNQMQRTFGLTVSENINFCHLMWRMKIISVEETIRQLKDWTQIEQVTFRHLDSLRFFFDFYQYYFYKSGRTDVLKLDYSLMTLVEEAFKLYEEKKVVTWPDLEGVLQKKLKITLTPDHIQRLDKKGLFLQRMTKDGAVYLDGDWKEVSNILWSWRFLHIFDTANQFGNVEFEIEEAKVIDETKCPKCTADITPEQKFCAECGHSLVAKKAA